jgi:hypothetical protein
MDNRSEGYHVDLRDTSFLLVECGQGYPLTRVYGGMSKGLPRAELVLFEKSGHMTDDKYLSVGRRFLNQHIQ